MKSFSEIFFGTGGSPEKHAQTIKGGGGGAEGEGSRGGGFQIKQQ